MTPDERKKTLLRAAEIIEKVAPLMLIVRSVPPSLRENVADGDVAQAILNVGATAARLRDMALEIEQ